MKKLLKIIKNKWFWIILGFVILLVIILITPGLRNFFGMISASIVSILAIIFVSEEMKAAEEEQNNKERLKSIDKQIEGIIENEENIKNNNDNLDDIIDRVNKGKSKQ